ncbi:Phox homologous domain-containing protein [Kalaharituber pfeilii]|nr:Phox homologous domain-containing protein [Kalaharituber pfeilii]
MLSRTCSRTHSISSIANKSDLAKRNSSRDSLQVIAPILLLDNTVTPGENSPSLWARNVRVTDYTIVQGSRTRAGAYVLWNCWIETLEGAQFTVRRRYSEFVTLRDKLCVTFPRSLASLPALPPKSVVSKFRAAFLENRRQGLSYFLSCILLNPEFAGSPLVKDFFAA